LSLDSSDGVYFVPAFAGLGAPYWNMNARAVISGITGGTTYKHIVRAALEAMAYQTKDVLMAMEKDSGIKINSLNVDGGATSNNFLLQFQSDILGVNVVRPEIIESTALGAAFLAALATGFVKIDDIPNIRKAGKVFNPKMISKTSDKLYTGWLNAISKINA